LFGRFVLLFIPQSKSGGKSVRLKTSATTVTTAIATAIILISPSIAPNGTRAATVVPPPAISGPVNLDKDSFAEL
jgi:hypothetical protein